MSLVAILARLRAQRRVNAVQPAKMTLRSGLGVEARADGSWVLWRPGVEPSDREVEVVARDAKLTGGFKLETKPGKGGNMIYRLLTPLDDDPEFASNDLCERCRSRTMLEDNSGGTYCPNCGEGTGDPLPLEPVTRDSVPAEDVDPVEMAIDWAALEVGIDPAKGADETVIADAEFRPGVRLENPGVLEVGRLHHFQSGGRMWVVKLEMVNSGSGDKVPFVRWSNLGGRYGGLEGSLERWRTWFAEHGQLSPLERRGQA